MYRLKRFPQCFQIEKITLDQQIFLLTEELFQQNVDEDFKGCVG